MRPASGTIPALRGRPRPIQFLPFNLAKPSGHRLLRARYIRPRLDTDLLGAGSLVRVHKVSVVLLADVSPRVVQQCFHDRRSLLHCAASKRILSIWITAFYVSTGTAGAHKVNTGGTQLVFAGITQMAELCSAATNAVHLSRRRIVQSRSLVVHNFPPEEVTGPPQCTCVRVAKNNEVFWLEYNNEVIFIASDRHLSPWLNKTINRIKACRQFSLHAHGTKCGARSPILGGCSVLRCPQASRLDSHGGRHDAASKGRTAIPAGRRRMCFSAICRPGY